jgi:hypothetical protein
VQKYNKKKKKIKKKGASNEVVLFQSKSKTQNQLGRSEHYHQKKKK